MNEHKFWEQKEIIPENPDGDYKDWWNTVTAMMNDDEVTTFEYWTEQEYEEGSPIKEFYNIEFITEPDGTVKDIILCNATGGPHCEINTSTRKYYLYWGGRTYVRYLTKEVCDQIVDYWAEHYYPH